MFKVTISDDDGKSVKIYGPVPGFSDTFAARSQFVVMMVATGQPLHLPNAPDLTALIGWVFSRTSWTYTRWDEPLFREYSTLQSYVSPAGQFQQRIGTLITVSQIDRELVAHEEQQPDTIPNRSNTEPQQQKVLVHSKI